MPDDMGKLRVPRNIQWDVPDKNGDLDVPPKEQRMETQ
jgi:hypothetical protein